MSAESERERSRALLRIAERVQGASVPCREQQAGASRNIVLVIVALAFFCQGAGGAETPRADKIQFNRDVRPILSDKCFQCHGPDSKKRQADLRLDTRDAAVEAGAITPGKPTESGLLQRIASEDEAERMPPRTAKLDPLTPKEIDTLRRWIEEGAEYEGHWSFIPLRPVPVPDNGATTAIDAIVSAGLARVGLAQQPEADRYTLIRRVSFDLTGLPPSPAEIAAFVNDPATDAYERLVDRLLASEHYGERMASDWLDAARYADSYGFQVDREREVWPWRDWVVRAFNGNMPLDRFITWQLAGDLLPDATDEQILATAFNRLHQQESEGGSVEEEYRVEYVCDRVQTFATTFLGLTMECCRCHDHKYDPITQRQYYQFFSLFQNIDEAGLYSYFTPSAPTPALPLADAQNEGDIGLSGGKGAGRRGRACGERELRCAAFDAWLASQARWRPRHRRPRVTPAERCCAESWPASTSRRWTKTSWPTPLTRKSRRCCAARTSWCRAERDKQCSSRGTTRSIYRWGILRGSSRFRCRYG